MATSVEQIKQQLASEDLGARLRAVNLLRDIEPAIAFELIQTVVSDESSRVRYAAISQFSSLGSQDPQTALTILKNSLYHDPEADVQAAAADSISALKLTEAYDDLATVYESSSEWIVQMSIVACLGELGVERGFDLLQKALKSDNSLVSLTAIGALGELQDPRAVPLLLPFASHEDWQVRHRLAQALGNYVQTTHQDQVQPTLAALAQDSSEIVSDAAQRSLS
ncbi:phycobilisome degradation protein NblB [Leptothoe kymatousa]|uniref:HEAT repeat domain-containing protein n=1 Tax=Leptothoe kymatousa TAU-MAC 1615 TaxID=2364775 RepID=A0ABS5Y3H9_9CYAN|nr:HEAT repeat domain-containing protein [Leptothoe kymatousa]MBT9312393.1 HEAT repeat domain-containing protein [Leptothoe kymatousa TAU-MAC 1615]